VNSLKLAWQWRWLKFQCSFLNIPTNSGLESTDQIFLAFLAAVTLDHQIGLNCTIYTVVALVYTKDGIYMLYMYVGYIVHVHLSLVVAGVRRRLGRLLHCGHPSPRNLWAPRSPHAADNCENGKGWQDQVYHWVSTCFSVKE